MNDGLALQLIDRLDAIKRDVNKQGIRVERLTVLQEGQSRELDRLSTSVDAMRKELPKLEGLAERHSKLHLQIVEHDRRICEHTGQINTLVSRVTPKEGIRKPSLPATKEFDPKDWQQIIKLIAWAAVAAAGITAAAASAYFSGWVGDSKPNYSNTPRVLPSLAEPKE